jgi:hypothetical protein
MWITGGLGITLILAGALLPKRLGPIHRAWMAMAHAISKITTPIFMGVVYYAVFAPSGWVMRAFGMRPLVHREVDGSFWQPTTRSGHSDLRRQF